MDSAIQRARGKLPKFSKPVQDSIGDLDRMIESAGGLDKIGGVGFIEGAAPSAALGQMAQEFRQNAKNISNLYGNELFGSALTATEAAAKKQAISDIEGGQTVGQVMNGLNVMRKFNARRTAQSLAGEHPEVVRRIAEDMNRRDDDLGGSNIYGHKPVAPKPAPAPGMKRIKLGQRLGWWDPNEPMPAGAEVVGGR